MGLVNVKSNINIMIDINAHILCPHCKEKFRHSPIKLERYIEPSNIFPRDGQSLLINTAKLQSIF